MKDYIIVSLLDKNKTIESVGKKLVLADRNLVQSQRFRISL